MAHTTSLTRETGMYVLRCEECGEITRQPANRGGLLARGERHEKDPTGARKGARVEVVRVAPRVVDIEELVEKGVYKRPAFQQAVADNICMQCGGPLKSQEGGFCTTAFPVRAVCRTCKTGVPA